MSVTPVCSPLRPPMQLEKGPGPGEKKALRGHRMLRLPHLRPCRILVPALGTLLVETFLAGALPLANRLLWSIFVIALLASSTLALGHTEVSICKAQSLEWRRAETVWAKSSKAPSCSLTPRKHSPVLQNSRQPVILRQNPYGERPTHQQPTGGPCLHCPAT